MKLDKNLASLCVFMIGIGGISMSGLAKLLLSWGCKMSGSDMCSSDITDQLSSLGISISIGHSADNITHDIDLIVYSGAIDMGNAEIMRARELGIQIIERSELLGMIASQYNHVIAISGTHGKTTTTAMISEIFSTAGMRPTIHIGGVSVNLKNNTIVGDQDYIILEACEYRESFKYLSPETLVITNIESDHLDYYKDINDIYSAFQRLANRSQYVITNDKNIHHDNHICVCDFSAYNIKVKDGGYDFDIDYLDEFYGHIRLNLIGRHNITNALLAIIVAQKYNISRDLVISALESFRGVERRYEYIGGICKLPVIIDYAHHPTEIMSSIAGIKEVYHSPLIIFQPHTFTRTLQLFNEFVSVLSRFNDVILFKTYPAREKEIIGGRAEDLTKHIKNASFINNMDDLITAIDKRLSLGKNDCVLVLGAGDLAIRLKNRINSKNN